MVAFSAYPPLEGLFDLAHREGVDIRPTLLRVLTDLYVQKPTHSEAEETQYIELASHLIETVDAPTRAVVHERLMNYSAAPAALLERLATLNQVAGPPIAPASSEVEDVDGNDSTSIMHAGSEGLTESFFAASPEERRFILINLDAFVPAAESAALTASPAIIQEIETAALDHNVGRLARALEHALGIDHGLAERVVNDPSGEPIVVAARALGIPADALQRILLFINPHVGQSVKRVFSLASLFEEITPAAAKEMVSIWRGARDKRRAHHEPTLWHREQRELRSHAHAARPADTRKEPNDLRSALGVDH